MASEMMKIPVEQFVQLVNANTKLMALEMQFNEMKNRIDNFCDTAEANIIDELKKDREKLKRPDWPLRNENYTIDIKDINYLRGLSPYYEPELDKYEEDDDDI